MRLNQHPPFDGQCEAASKVYKQCRGAAGVMMRYGESPVGAEVRLRKASTR